MDEVVAKRTSIAESPRTAVQVVAVILFAMLVADQLMILVLSFVEGNRDLQQIIAGLMIGIFASQLLLVVAYASLGDGHSPKRIIYSTLVVAVFTNALCLLNTWWFEVPWSEAVIGCFLTPMLLFFLLQIPFWGIRSCFNWTIKSPWSEVTKRRPMHFSLAHLLGWSAFLSVPLCILQAILPGEAVGFAHFCFFLIWGVVLCALVTWFLYIALAADMDRWKFIIAAGLALVVVVGAQLATLLFWGVRVNARTVLPPSTAIFSGGAMMLLCLRLAYGLGFRLLPFAAKRSEMGNGPDGRTLPQA